METEVKYLVKGSLKELETKLKLAYKKLMYVGDLDLPAIYYDTETGSFEQNKAALRVRKEEGHLIGCYKAVTSQERVFVEEEIELVEENLKKEWFMRFQAYPDIAKIANNKEIRPKVKIDTKRRVYLLKNNGLVLEVVLDLVDYLDGIFEEKRMEVELKEGDLHIFEQFLKELETKIDGLQETVKSKYQTANELLKEDA